MTLSTITTKAIQNIISLQEEGSRDKEATSHDDLLDSFQMSLLFWH